MKAKVLLTVGLLLLAYGLSVAQSNTHLAKDKKEGKLTANGLWISDDVQEITGMNKMGPFVRLNDGGILTIDTTTTFISKDEGKSWTPPVVFAKIVKQGTPRETLLGLSYPYFFEAKPGEIWITTMFGGLRCKLYEKDFTSANSDSLVIVAFGNSITATRKTVNQVFAQRLPGLLAEREVYARVINSGIGGSHTGHLSDNNIHKVRHASDRFESDVLSHQPDVVLISFGTNDSFIDSRKAGGPSRIPLKNYEENLTHFIETLQSRKVRVVLIAPGPFVKEYAGFQNERLIQYAQVVRELAKKYKTGLVDNFNDFNKYAADTGEAVDALMSDASHPNDKGHKIIADNLVKEIIRVLALSHE